MGEVSLVSLQIFAAKSSQALGEAAACFLPPFKLIAANGGEHEQHGQRARKGGAYARSGGDGCLVHELVSFVVGAYGRDGWRVS